MEEPHEHHRALGVADQQDAAAVVVVGEVVGESRPDALVCGLDDGRVDLAGIECLDRRLRIRRGKDVAYLREGRGLCDRDSHFFRVDR